MALLSVESTMSPATDHRSIAPPQSCTAGFECGEPTSNPVQKRKAHYSVIVALGVAFGMICFLVLAPLEAQPHGRSIGKALASAFPRSYLRSNAPVMSISEASLSSSEKLQRTAVERMSKSLGPDDPDTVASKERLILTLLARGDVTGAQKLQEEVVQTKSHACGAEHAATLASKRHLQCFRGAQELPRKVLASITRRQLGAGFLGALLAAPSMVPQPAAARYMMFKAAEDQFALEEAEKKAGIRKRNTYTAQELAAMERESSMRWYAAKGMKPPERRKPKYCPGLPSMGGNIDNICEDVGISVADAAVKSGSDGTGGRIYNTDTGKVETGKLKPGTILPSQVRQSSGSMR